MERSKGVAAFSIYFIVWSIITFIKSIALFLYYLLISTLVTVPTVVTAISQHGLPSFFDWVIALLGIACSILLFFAGYHVLKHKAAGIKLLTFACGFLIINNVLRITEKIREVMIVRTEQYANFAVYGASMFIAIYIFSILLWIFVIWWFSKDDVKKQLK